jgi:hypothetical protein
MKNEKAFSVCSHQRALNYPLPGKLIGSIPKRDPLLRRGPFPPLRQPQSKFLFDALKEQIGYKERSRKEGRSGRIRRRSGSEMFLHSRG